MDHLQTEARNPASTNLDELTPLELVRLMNREDGRVLSAVASQAEAIARAIELVADRLRAGGRLIYVGAGTSGRLGVLDATECPPTFSTPPGQVIGLIAGGPAALTRAVEGAEDRPELAPADLDAISLSAHDVVVGVATSGRTPYVLSAMAHARERGASTIGLSCNPDSELSAAVDLPITPVVGPEVLSGSTRLKAGTATKLVLNMLSTGAMVRLGKTFGNLMVDLRATNSKLRARTSRIVRTLTGLSVEAAEAVLQQCGGELKTALVVAKSGASPEEARARLNAARGQVRKALDVSSIFTESPREPASDLYLGIDGGGTHTVALLATPDGKGSWQVLGRGQAGPSNLHAVGPERALRALEEAVNAAFVAAKRDRSPVAAACLGLAGAGRSDDQCIVQEWARRIRLAEKVEVTTDAMILLAAGTPEGHGLVVIAGTGSIAYARNADGRTARSGGWGYLLGDEGSGYALVMAGLRGVLRAADGRGPVTGLTDRLLPALGIKEPQELVRVIYQSVPDRAALAALAPLVLQEREEEDGVARDVVEGEARQLALTAAAAAAQGDLAGKPVPLALAGGVLLGSATYRDDFLRALGYVGITVSSVTLLHEAAEGALRRVAAVMPLDLPTGT
jgi:N-acetylmuramic acid 6-phosphate etherase